MYTADLFTREFFAFTKTAEILGSTYEGFTQPRVTMFTICYAANAEIAPALKNKLCAVHNKQILNNHATQYNLTVPSGRDASIKIFSNGTVQICNLRNADDVAFFEQLCDPKKPNFDMHTLDAVFRCPYAVNLVALDDLCINVLDIHTRGVTEHYCALIIKTENASIHVFSTGSIMLKGIKQLCALVEAYALIINILSLYQPRLMLRKQ